MSAYANSVHQSLSPTPRRPHRRLGRRSRSPHPTRTDGRTDATVYSRTSSKLGNRSVTVPQIIIHPLLKNVARRATVITDHPISMATPTLLGTLFASVDVRRTTSWRWQRRQLVEASRGGSVNSASMYKCCRQICQKVRSGICLRCLLVCNEDKLHHRSHCTRICPMAA